MAATNDPPRRNMSNLRPLPTEEERRGDYVPGDETAEQGVLGCILENAREILPQVRRILSPGDFGRDKHNIIYRAIIDMFDRGDPVDISTVPIELRRLGKLEAVEGVSYVTSLPNLIANVYDAEYFARSVHDAAMDRHAIAWAEQVSALGYGNAGASKIVAEIDRLHDELHERVGAVAPRRFGILSDMELEQERPSRGILGNWIRDKEIVPIYGATESYKTFLAISIGGCWATGLDWYGMPAEQRTVLYIAAEAPGTIRDRLAAWKQHHGMAGQQIDFYTSTLPVDISSAEDVRAFIAEVRECLPDAPGAVIIDTYACATSGEEKDGASVNAAYRGMRMLRDAFGATIVYVDHEGKDRERGQTGSQRKKDNADVQIHVERLEGSEGLVSVKATKIKSDESPSPLTLQTKRISFYDNRTQEMRNSLVLLNTSKAVAQAASNEARSERLSRRQRQALDALTDLPESSASYGDWLRACRGSGDESTFRKSTFDDCRKYLLKMRLVSLENDIYASLVRNKNRTSTPAPLRTGTVGTGGIYTPVPDRTNEVPEASEVAPDAWQSMGDVQTAPYHRHDPKTARKQRDGMVICDDCHPRPSTLPPKGA